jgi:hypothetical protein
LDAQLIVVSLKALACLQPRRSHERCDNMPNPITPCYRLRIRKLVQLRLLPILQAPQPRIGKPPIRPRGATTGLIGGSFFS